MQSTLSTEVPDTYQLLARALGVVGWRPQCVLGNRRVWGEDEMLTQGPSSAVCPTSALYYICLVTFPRSSCCLPPNYIAIEDGVDIP